VIRVLTFMPGNLSTGLFRTSSKRRRVWKWDAEVL
jgi:hypothetical protein